MHALSPTAHRSPFTPSASSHSLLAPATADGFPVLEGNVEEIEGKALEIRKVCDRSISDNTRECIREFCTVRAAGESLADGLRLAVGWNGAKSLQACVRLAGCRRRRPPADRQRPPPSPSSLALFGPLLLQQLVAAINKYYAFGSCFADDST